MCYCLIPYGYYKSFSYINVSKLWKRSSSWKGFYPDRYIVRAIETLIWWFNLAFITANLAFQSVSNLARAETRSNVKATWMPVETTFPTNVPTGVKMWRSQQKPVDKRRGRDDRPEVSHKAPAWMTMSCLFALKGRHTFLPLHYRGMSWKARRWGGAKTWIFKNDKMGWLG